MEFPELGKQCSNSQCKQLDFLPMVCDACSEVFCVQHYKYDDHSCPKSYLKNKQVPICPLCNQPVPMRKGDQLPDVRVNQHIEDDCQDNRALKKRNAIYKNRCSFDRCKQKELVPITCHNCGLNYCLKHRHPLDHKCNNFKRDQDKRGNGTTGRSLSKAAEAALRRANSTNKNTGTSCHQPTSTKINQVQGDLDEDEALARAIHQSLNDRRPGSTKQSHSSGLGSSSLEDTLLAEALERSQKDYSRTNRNNCSLT